jgi:hypothetical protein
MGHDLFEGSVGVQSNIESSSRSMTLTQTRCAICIDEIEETLRNSKRSIIFESFYRLNAAVQRPRDHVSSVAQAHNEMTRLRRASDWVSRSAATACQAPARCGASLQSSR